MRKHGPQLEGVLSKSFNRRLLVDVFHGSDRVLEDVPVESWSFEAGLSGKLKTGGKGVIVHQSVNGESLLPVGTKGVLSAFRARLLFTLEVSAGSLKERVVLGWGRVVANPPGRDTSMTLMGVPRVVASYVPVEWDGLDVELDRRGFRFPETPPSLMSCWEEVRRITGFPVVTNMPDKAIPADTVWEAKQGGRLEAVQALAGLLGGRMVVNPEGALTVAPDEWGDPVGELVIGENGTIVDLADEVDTDDVYTAVVGTFETPDRKPLYAVAEVTRGDLAVDGLFPENTRYYSSPLVDTQAEANAAVQSVLDSSIGSQTYEVPIQCVINPLIELGDVVKVVGHTRELEGRVVKYNLSDSELMNVVLEARRSLS